VQVRRIEFLAGTIAIVDLNFRLTGFSFLPPGLRETEPGVQPLHAGLTLHMNAVVVIVVVIWLLQAFGVLGSIGNVRIG
jgi:hypothetical protein